MSRLLVRSKASTVASAAQTGAMPANGARRTADLPARVHDPAERRRGQILNSAADVEEAQESPTQRLGDEDPDERADQRADLRMDGATDRRSEDPGKHRTDDCAQGGIGSLTELQRHIEDAEPDDGWTPSRRSVMSMSPAPVSSPGQQLDGDETTASGRGEQRPGDARGEARS